jgi:uncharacterized repeat protein (TIGR01451 family)
MFSNHTHEARQSSLRRRALLGALLLLLGVTPPAHAVTNAALGGIGGINNGTLSGGDGTGTGQVSFGVVDLGLRKQARDRAGTVLPNGADVAAGQEIYFVLYVDNPTPHPADDLQISDLLNEAEFTYVPNSLESATMASGSNDAAMWAATWTPLTDAPGSSGDIASIVDTGGPTGGDRITIGSVPTQANSLVQLPGNTRIAVRFRVRVR